MGSINEMLYTVLANYPRPDDLSTENDYVAEGDRMYGLVEDEVPKQVETALERAGIDSQKFLISGSVGPGSYTYVPYVPIMHLQNTDTPNQGQYVVYLFDPAGDSLYLALTQGTPELQELADDTNYSANEVARLRARTLASEIHRPSGFETGPIEFETRGEGGRVYVSGAVYYQMYTLNSFPSTEQVQEDLASIVTAYLDWVEKREGVLDFPT